MNQMVACLRRTLLILLMLVAPLELSATITLSLSPDLSSPRAVGTPIVWTASATDSSPGTLTYRFVVAPQGGTFAIVRDYNYNSTFQWVQSSAEGRFVVGVFVKNNSTKELVNATSHFTITPLATTNSPVVVTPTANPLVALYSTTVCPSGYSVAVAFQAVGDTTTQYTPAQPCTKATLNTYIAGMRANTLYVMTAGTFANGGFWPITSSVAFTTGSISGVSFPTMTVLSPPPAAATVRPVLLHSYIGVTYNETATDLNGNIIWYYASPDKSHPYATRPEPGGKMLMVFLGANDPYNQSLREIDLAGNTRWETSAGAVNEQLVALGAQPITSLHHEARRLANGNLLLLGSVERMTPGVQGGADVLGDEIIVMNSSLKVLWTWNAFDHLDVNRTAILGETCTNLAPGCPPIHLASIANDWMHSNAADVGSDGSILLSVRHQDWVIKIDYGNGSGTGDVLWRLGNGGDFSIVPADPTDLYPWFSHQHDVHWEFGAMQYMSLFDNGNTRHVTYPTAHSRGQFLSIDENARVATQILNMDVGVYSPAVGSAQILSDNNMTGVHYEAGDINGTPMSQSISFYPTGTADLQSGSITYRSFQMMDMYRP